MSLRGLDKYKSGLKHLEAGRLNSAEAALRAVASTNPGFAEAHYNLGLVLRRRGKLLPAAHSFRSAVKASPEFAEAHGALAATLHRLGQDPLAEVHARRATALNPGPDYAPALLADILRAQGRLAEARKTHEGILSVCPDEASARFGRAFLNLLEGDLTAGWADYEFRPARRGPPPPPLARQWRGEPLAGRTVLLYAEQGLGDTIQFLRYAPVLASTGAKLLLAVPTPLMELAAGVDGVHEVVQPSYVLPAFDFCAPLPSLPFLLNSTVDVIPLSAGYLSPPEGRRAKWEARLGSSRKMTVAIAWAGNADHPNDHNRSARTEDIAPLLDLPGVRWLNLQKKPGSALPVPRKAEVIDLGNELTDFADTAAIVQSADLVISVDTALCHLGGALGRTTWTLLPYAPDWRWLRDRSDSPWYASMRLFRQSTPGDWRGVIHEVALALSRTAVQDAAG